MAHYFHIQAWQMQKLTPWEHDSLVHQTTVQLNPQPSPDR
jgi:hypothetical protein